MRRLLPAMVLFTACAAPTGATPDYVGGLGKADNFYSGVASEFLLEARIPMQFAADEGATGEAARVVAEGLVAERQTALASAVTSHFEGAFDGHAARRRGVLVRRASDEGLSLIELDEDLLARGESVAGAPFTFVFRAEVAGLNNLDEELSEIVNGVRVVRVRAGGEEVELTMTRQDNVADAYPRYMELFEGGLDIHFFVGSGKDDNEADQAAKRQDVADIFAMLVGLGFEAPVRRASDLRLDSAPFTRTIRVADEDVEARARIFHRSMVDQADVGLVLDQFVASVETADIVTYAGHAGPGNARFIFSYPAPQTAFYSRDFERLNLSDRYQIFLFQGCKTYGSYVDNLLRHPNKSYENVDAVTTVNSSSVGAGDRVFGVFFTGLLAEVDGRWLPRPWGALMNEIHEETAGDVWLPVHAVTGIEDNPRISPLADLDLLGQACQVSGQCGAPDSLCVPTPLSGDRVCGAACTDTSGCPTGMSCEPYQIRGGFSHQCVPTR